MNIPAKRTPDECFQNLPDYPFQPHYLENLQGYKGLRMHYVDEGPKDAKHTFLCLHGQPTWSYLYRKMIPIFVESGARVIAPDWFGFGKSDKPIEDSTYSFHFHRTSMIQLIQKLDLKNITLVCQDWGGLLGLTIPMDMPERFSRLLIMNTALATGTYDLGPGFYKWREFNKANPDLNLQKLMKSWCPILSENEAQAYAAPFPDQSYKAGVRMFPNLVCDNPDAEGADTSRQALKFWQNDWTGQAFMAIGMQDPVIPPQAMLLLHGNIKNCLSPFKVEQAGHFVQEQGDIVAKEALKAFEG